MLKTNTVPFVAMLMVLSGCTTFPSSLSPQVFGHRLEKLKEEKSKHVTLRYDIPEKYGSPILQLCETLLEVYRERYGIDLLEYCPDKRLRVVAMWRPSRSGRSVYMCTSKQGLIYLRAGSETDLGEPNDDPNDPRGAHWVYGFGHELGHTAIFLDNTSFSEGIADYFGAVLIPYVYERLGASAWGQPYDYLHLDRVWLWNRRNEEEVPVKTKVFKHGSSLAACKVLFTIEDKHGSLLLGAAIKKMRAEVTPQSRWWLRILPTYRNYWSLKDFKKILIEMTGDETIWMLFEENGF